MLFFTLAGDQNIIKVYHHKPLNVRPKHLVHEPHKSAWSIG